MSGQVPMGVFSFVSARYEYYSSYDTNINKLRTEFPKLQRKRNEIEGKVEEAKKTNEKINDGVQTWLTDVDKIITEAERFLENDEEKTRCLEGLCINCIARWKSIKKAIEYVDKITELIDDPRLSRPISHRAPLPERVLASLITASELSVGRGSQVKEIQNALYEDGGTHIIGICGMAGVGKTTMMEEITIHARDNHKFDEIIKLVVSNNPNLITIQDQIAEKLGLTFHEASKRVTDLWWRIKQVDNILIVLDDVWDEIDLTHEIGIPYGKNHTGCKILLTSRNEAVCNWIGAKTFSIKVLDENESWELFREVAGKEAVDRSDIKDIAKEVSNECGGLPLVIVTVARALRGKDRNGWTIAAAQLKTSFDTEIGGIDQKLFSSLQPSYDFLGEEEKRLFLLFCLYPKGYHIKAEELVTSVVGLRLFGNVTRVEDARTRTCSLLSNLVSSFLMVKNKDGYKMHGVVRDFAIHISSSEEESSMHYLAKPSVGLRYWPDSDATIQGFKGISLMHNCIKVLPDDLYCPQLQILFLQQNSPESPMKVPDDFFQRMKALRVIDMSSNCLPKLPPSVTELTTLTSLSLECCKLDDISIVGTLHQLEILRLSGNDNIEEIPENFSELTLLRLFDLRKCHGVRRIAAGVISIIKKLEELYIERTAEQSISEALSADQGPFTRLNSLMGVSLENAEILSRLVTCQNLIRFDILFGKPTNDADYFRSRECEELLIHELNPKLLYLICGSTGFHNDEELLLRKTQHLSLLDCDSVVCFLNLDGEGGFMNLKSLILRRCERIEYISKADDWRTSSRIPLRNLGYLKLFCLGALIEISHGELPTDSFAEVRFVEVEQCDILLNIVPSKLLTRMKHLQQVKVSSCDHLTHVFDLQELADNGHQYLSMLKDLELCHLDEIICIWKGPHHLVTLSNLENVSVQGCPKLKQLFSSQLVQGLVSLEKLQVARMEILEEVFGKHEASEIVEIRHGPDPVTGLNKLTQIVMEDCNSLVSIFSPTIAKCLVKLETLVIRSCSKMETIMVQEESVDMIEFPKLIKIELFELGSLTCFCTGQYLLNFPCLETLDIFDCPAMETFYHGGGQLMTPKLKLVQIADDEYVRMDNLNDTVHRIFTGEAVVIEQDG